MPERDGKADQGELFLTSITPIEAGLDVIIRLREKG